MISSIALVVSFLSLFSSARAATISARQDGCTFVCPDADLNGNALSASAPGVATVTSTYLGDSLNSCTYDSVSFIPLSRCQPKLKLDLRTPGHLQVVVIAPGRQFNNALRVGGESSNKR